MNGKALLISCLAVPVMLSGGESSGRERASQEQASIRNGRYMVMIAGCNDCHTSSYAQSESRVKESEWLKGDNLGWNGAWGTTYPVNLRLLVSSMTEKSWMQTVKTARSRPPMPWYALRDMHDNDFRDIYRYLRHLGPAGVPAPGFVPPGKVPAGPAVRYPQ